MPGILKGESTDALNVHTAQGTGHCIKPGGNHEGIELDMLFVQRHPLGRDLNQGRVPQVNQSNVILIVGLVVIDIDADPPGTNRMRRGAERISCNRILNP